MKVMSFEDFVEFMYSIRNYDDFYDFMDGITSDKDKQNLPKRVEIVKKLLDGENHHIIADDLGVGVATVTKGSKLLAKDYFKVLRKQISAEKNEVGQKGYFGKYGGRYVP